MLPPDEIHVASLVLRAHVGVTDAEQAQAQRLTVSLTIQPKRGLANLDDRIENAVNYSTVCATVHALAASGPRRLIETLACEIADAILTQFPVASVTVELRKYILPDTDHVAVRLTRDRPPAPEI